MLTVGVIFISISYLLIIGWLTYGFDQVSDFKLQDLPSKTSFSIIIPFRNEAKSLPHLLNSISKLQYPRHLFEVILVDDDSDDDSVTVISKLTSEKSFNNINIQTITNIRQSNSPKKDAINSAVKTSKFNWIITTDADCILPNYWLDAFDAFIQTQHPNSIVAPVTYHGETSFLNRFQTLDFLSLQGATIGGFGIKHPIMCNGANFAYRKSSFVAVNGFKDNDAIASGDDVFLLEKFLALDQAKVQYLKSSHAMVTTSPAKDLKHLIHQRLRWASKASHYNNWFTKLIGLMVLLGNLLCLGLIPAVYFNLFSIKIAFALFIIKFSIDFLLLFKTARFFKQEKQLSSYLLASVLYPIFNVSIALLAVFTSYEWKGRKFRK
ncbi:glycosyltransferase [Winogradskyella vidalii]|uniref:glycosyltransferase n=1 Tax=Winogradskyella vidalii TaxID=2615024 RepID=UPI0015C9AB27|nr:glycosyltransferase [Winogradskyella vidalii]